ncbi:MAG TPA: DUF6152 family protein [Gammaproteobacteria bacterium]|nr:DUF6152 family protein [Gammaproteobacteria bacterium]
MPRNAVFLETLTIGSLTLAASSIVFAHHGVSGYDMREVRELEGVVVKWDWKNPHTWLTLAVTGDGELQTWEIEGAPPQWMAGQGWSPESLATGEAVSITFHPLKEPANGGILMQVARGNGEVLKVNRPARLGGP